MPTIPEAANQQFSKWPTDIAIALGSTFLPTSLIFFIKNPAFYTVFGMHTMLVMAFAATMPIFMLSFLVVVAWELTDTTGDEVEQEWSRVRAAGGMTTLIVYPAVVVAYFTDLRIGTILLGVTGAQILIIAAAALRVIIQGERSRAGLTQRRPKQ